MKQLEGKTALITGGASGIGKIMARLLLERRAKVIIWDINQSNIDKTISELSAKGDVYGFNVDVSDITKIQEAAKKVKLEVGIVDVLINNAGIVVGKYFHEHNTQDILKTMEINANAPIVCFQSVFRRYAQSKFRTYL